MKVKRTKNIFIEGSSLYQQRSGVGQYTKKLFEELAILDKKNIYTFFAFLIMGKKKPQRPIMVDNVRYSYIRTMPGRVYNKIIKAGLALAIDHLLLKKADLWIFPNFIIWPLSQKQIAVSVIYDISFLTHAEYSDKKNSKYLSDFIPKTVHRANKIITISNNSKNEIEEHYPEARGKIEIISPAVDHSAFMPQSKGTIEKIKNNYGIKGKYILYTGTIEPRKNIVGILEAYSRLPKSLLDEYILVLAGGKGWKDGEIYHKIETLSYLNIIMTGYVQDMDLPALYSGATVFVYPSFYEGFGMPPLEAMACGTPVITSNNSSLPEVVGEAGIMIDAKDNKALTKSIKKVISSKKLQNEMIKKGIEQAKKFSWEKSAKKLHDLTESIS